ncbi:hypothetical protein BO71DRAFT_487355 [Aspergillus ellipticus CBS 707.79]|uniref:Aminoglycoside phosphotransferase domain-containing protein n=1 Tax=Aspergillus ellipticus CBS 707.79 TaxID=1448320 RepID=A0A319CYP4_9EURO|nr:hypothetical protein BO71DRAFT_487355 [Aspergillus ellipticus CBS 707.79]
MTTSNRTTTPSPNEEFFRYTSGRWLWDEEQQLQDRHKVFNVPQLKNIAARAVGADRCVSRTKLAEGFSYGSIYFASDAVEGAVPASIISDCDLELKEELAKTFTIGPSVDRGFWNKESSAMDIARGPCMDQSIGRREIAWIKKYAVPKATDDPLLVSMAQNNPETHIQLLERYLRVAPHLVDVDRQLACSTLWHTDLHSSNLFVEGDHITAVIDWQGVWAGPLFLQAQPSRLVNYEGEMLLQRPDDFDSLDDDRKAQIKQQISKSTLFQLYLMETAERNPVLAEAFHSDHGKTRRLPVEFAGNTWDDDIVSFREALVNVQRISHWGELGIKGDCPINFTEEELKTDLEDANGWNEVQDFFDSIEGLVKRDGWTHNETFDEALEFLSSLRKIDLKNIKGKERESFEKQTRWAKG